MPAKKEQKMKWRINFFMPFCWPGVPKAGIFRFFVAGMRHSLERLAPGASAHTFDYQIGRFLLWEYMDGGLWW